jgi:hypothetical protein
VVLCKLTDPSDIRSWWSTDPSAERERSQ